MRLLWENKKAMKKVEFMGLSNELISKKEQGKQARKNDFSD